MKEDVLCDFCGWDKAKQASGLQGIGIDFLDFGPVWLGQDPLLITRVMNPGDVDAQPLE